MSFFQEDGVLTSRTSTGTDVVTLTGSGAALDVKLIRLTMNGAIATGGANADYLIAQGFSDGTDERCITGFSEDGVASVSNARSAIHDDSVLTVYNSARTIIDQGTISDIGNGTFTINWPTTKSAAAYKIGWTAWGGSDLDGVKIGTQTHDATNVDGTSVSFTGVGFKPDALVSLMDNVSLAGAVNNDSNFVELALGMATGISNQGLITVTSQNLVATSNTQRYQRTDRCLETMSISSTTKFRESNFTSFDADGWTWVDEVSFNGLQVFFYVAVKGGQWEVGNGTTNTSASAKAFTTTFQPVGVSTISANNTVSASVVAHNHLSFGSTDGTTEHSFAAGDDDALGTTETGTYHSTTSLITTFTNTELTAGGGIASLVGEGAFDSFNSTDFTVDWTGNPDSAAREFIWMVCAGNAAGGLGNHYIPPMNAGYRNPRIQVRGL